MSKNEFLNQLESRLSKIDENERKDIIIEYGSYIDDKVNDGFSEEDAVAGFGDMDELVEEILSAYDFEETPPVFEESTSAKDALYETAENVWNETKDLTFSDILSLVFDVIVMCIVLWIIKFVLVDIILGFIFNPFGISRNIFGLLFVVIAIYFMYRVLLIRIKQLKNGSVKNSIFDDMKHVFNQTLDRKENDLPPMPNETVTPKSSSSDDFDIVKKILLVGAWFITVSIALGVFSFFCVLVYFHVAYGAFSYGVYTIVAGCMLACIGFMMMWVSLWPRKRG